MSKRSGEDLSPLAKRTKRDFSSDIVILVGKQEKRFVAHESIITDNSDFFRAACKGEWKESNEQVVRLPEVDPKIFEVHLGWLYTGNTDVLSNQAKEGEEPWMRYGDVPKGKVGEISTSLAECYTLGDLLQDVSFRNSVIDEFTTCTETTITVLDAFLIQQVCDIVTVESTLTKLCVDYIAVELTEKAFNKAVQKYPKAFLIEIAKACVRDRDLNKRETMPAHCERCFYHEHKDDKGKTKCCTK